MMTYLIVIVAVAAFAAVAYFTWRTWFKDSETLLWARLQMYVGALWAVLSVTDLAPILHVFGAGKYVPIAIFGMGLITEIARRNRATDL